MWGIVRGLETEVMTMMIKGNQMFEKFNEMNMDLFKSMNRTCPYFDGSVIDGAIEPIKVIGNDWQPKNWKEEYMYIFGLIFGAYGIRMDLDAALNRTLIDIKSIIKQKPENEYIDNEEYYYWLHYYGNLQILLGTIYAYKNEIIKASYHLITGLKTESVNLNLSYCDFIKYILNRLDMETYQEYDGKEGVGFSEDNPMGAVEGNRLIAKNAMIIIPELEGKDKEQIIVKQGQSGIYGHLVRLGSICNKKRQMVDVYETYLIDSKYVLSKIHFYFYGYFYGFKDEVKLPSGFKLVDGSLLRDEFIWV